MREEIKLVRVKKTVWDKLSVLREFPDRTKFGDVVEFLLNEYKKRSKGGNL